jgi:hypothetical protein
VKEPNCTHAATVRVSSHADLGYATGPEPMASVYCCDREKCRAEATFWVQGTTGRQAHVIPLPRRAASFPAGRTP